MTIMEFKWRINKSGSNHREPINACTISKHFILTGVLNECCLSTTCLPKDQNIVRKNSTKLVGIRHWQKSFKIASCCLQKNYVLIVFNTSFECVDTIKKTGFWRRMFENKESLVIFSSTFFPIVKSCFFSSIK